MHCGFCGVSFAGFTQHRSDLADRNELRNPQRQLTSDRYYLLSKPLLSAERSGARTGKGAGCKRAHARGKRKVRGRNLWGKGLFLLMDVELARSVVHLCRCERSEHRWFQGGRRTKFAGWG